MNQSMLMMFSTCLVCFFCLRGGLKFRTHLTFLRLRILQKYSLDRIERDEEIYLEHLRASSLAYRAPPSSLETGGNANSADHHQHHNSGVYPVVGVSSSSKLMSDILLQFHQEAESIDLLGVNAIQGNERNPDGASENSSGTSFFHKYQSQFQELFQRHQQKHRTDDHDSNIHVSTSLSNTVSSTNGPIAIESLTVKDSSINRNVESEDASHSSSMMMMSMNSSTTTLMSP
jgi:hypothetical protein